MAQAPEPRVTIGVDLATSPASTGVCVLDLATMRATIVDTPAERTIESITALAAHWWEATDGRCRIGIDAPFGWPVAWLDLLTRARDLDAIHPGESADPGSHAVARALRWRLTDIELSTRSHKVLRPMTPSMDRLAATTTRCLDLLARLRHAGLPITRTGIDSAAFEVYPTASLHEWSLRGAGGRVDARARFLSTISPRVAAEGLAATHEHDVDALVAALTVAGPMHAIRPEDADAATLEVEGVMHVPAAPLPFG